MGRTRVPSAVATVPKQPVASTAQVRNVFWGVNGSIRSNLSVCEMSFAMFFLGFGGGAGRLMEVFLTLWVRRDFGEMIKAFCTTFCSETLKFTKSCCFQIDRFSWPKPRGFEMPVKEPF